MLEHFDVLIIGAGLSGIGAAVHLQQNCPERSFALLDGVPVVAFGVYRASGQSDLTAGDGAKAKIAQLAQRYPNIRFSQRR